MEQLTVSTKTQASKLAGAVAGVIREKGCVEIRGIGPAAVNVAVKAIAIAHGFMAPQGVYLACTPAFVDVELDGEQKTAMKLVVEPIKRCIAR